MIEIKLLTEDYPEWGEIIALAENCSWRAGPVLAERMRRSVFLDWERVCAAFVDGEAAGFCTFSKTDELPENSGFTPFIGFVFVDERHRGKRLSQAMIEKIIPYAQSLGYRQIYILSGEIGLYEKFGFQKIGDYDTTYGTTDQLFVKQL